jgi:CBS domain-containing protein
MASTSSSDLPITAVTSDVIVRIGPDATLQEVADALATNDVGVLVVGDDRPAAIISERDVIRALAARRDLARTVARDIATDQLVWCDAAATVGEVANQMMEAYIRHVLVEEDGRAVGVVSARDLLGVYATSDTDDDG